MYDFEYAFFFYKMAAIKNLFLQETYSAKAYRVAAYTLDSYENYVEELIRHGELDRLPHVGKKIHAAIHEICETGTLEELRYYERKYSIQDYTLLLSKGLPDRIIKKMILKGILSVRDIDFANIDTNDFKPNELQKIERFIGEFHRLDGMYLFAYALCLGEEFIAYLKTLPNIIDASFSASFIQNNEKVCCIELVCQLKGSEDLLLESLRKWERLNNIDRHDRSIYGGTAFGIPFRLDIKDGGIISFYKKEDMMKDIRGDLHVHSNWSDGLHSIDDIVQRALGMGYEYVAITDHSVSQHIAHGLSVNEALDEIEEIRKLNAKYPIRILAGIEVDILHDGSLDYPDEVLQEFDFVIASIHSHFSMMEGEMLQRISKALSNPYVNIFAHPTGRLLGYPGSFFSERAPYLDYQKIIPLCKEHDVVMEINCFPERLDLNGCGICSALEQGVMLSLGTDSHSIAHMSNMKYGCFLLEEAGAPAESVLNSYSVQDLINFFSNQRKGKTPIVSVFSSTNLLKKDYTYYFGNNSRIMEGKCSVIGIDLTGSEKKASGWCLLVGNHVQCKQVETDCELLESIERIHPDIVSIDSPLAYPQGRDCARKDCECSKYGIMRKSERMLRHFGIPIYPCLIDSMIKLTTRGMNLAKVLRSRGYEVIESYPGVAQDVLHIQRKGKNRLQKEHLRKGLISFGLTGDLVSRTFLSHDELDAITSALVGYFYANNQYIAMGNDTEDYLIVPRVMSDLLKENVVIGLCGEIGAGKSTIAEFLQFQYGLPYCRYSRLLSMIYRVHSRDELQRIGAEVAESEEKQRDLTRRLIKSMEGQHSFVVDGLRHVEDYQELKNAYGDSFKLIYLECKGSIRYRRLQKERDEFLSKESFFRILNHKSEKDIAILRFYSEYVIENNGGYKDLFKKVKDILSQFFQKGGCL